MTGEVVAGETVGEPIIVDLVVIAEGLIPIVTLELTGLFEVGVALGETLVVTGTLDAAVRIDVLAIVGVAPGIDTNLVVTFSRMVDSAGAV